MILSELSDKLKVPENHVGLDESIRQKKHFLENKPHGLSYEEYLENQSPTSTAQPVVEKTGPSPFDGMPFLDDAANDAAPEAGDAGDTSDAGVVAYL